jgi:hypothetical protein
MRINSTEFKEFLTKWRDAITYQSRRWEGPQAVSELKREAGYLDFIRCRPDERLAPRWMLKGILDEVEDYRTENRIWQKDFRGTELFLAKIGRKVELQRNKVATGSPFSSRRVVENAEGFAIAQIEPSCFVAIEGPGATTAEYCDLVPTFVNGAIAIDPF